MARGFQSFIVGAALFSQQFAGLAYGNDSGEFYEYPGIVGYRNGKMVGSDHLYNLTNKIGVDVEILKPTDLKLPFTEESIKKTVADIFQKAKIQPEAESAGGLPPHPFFHVLLIIQPIEKGYVLTIEGRLFEQVKVNRVKLDEQTMMQAITWETQNMIVVPKEELSAQMNKLIDETANKFVERYKYFLNLKIQHEIQSL